MSALPKLGSQEMEILNYIGDRSSVSVRDAATYFEKEKGLARTTVMTVMERLRKKGLLSREQIDGIFHYSAKIEKDRFLQQKVSEFVQRTLGGSASPLFNYFFESSNLSEEELKQLKTLVEKMEAKDNV